MILQALNQYYETLVAQNKISRPGWDSSFKVAFALDLDSDGNLQELIDLRQARPKGKKTVLMPRNMIVPAHKSRTAGISGNFLCDNATYMLGADAKGKPQRAQECFAANAQLHRQVLEGVNTPASQAIRNFFDTWRPEEADHHPLLEPYWKEITGNANLIFFFDGCCAVDDAAIQAAWQQAYETEDPDAPVAQCLITGEVGPVAATHPSIKGVQDAQSSGAALVSFNAPAFCSYGHTQNFNAPVGTQAAFAYTTALNTLLADREHCKVIGDTTVVCWAEHGESAYQDAYMAAMFGTNEGISDQDLAAFLDKLAHGEPISWAETELSPDEHFYILGLAPNAARLSVRFFLRDTFGDFVRHINQHYKDTEIIRPSYDKFVNLPLWRLLSETVNQNSRSKAASPQLAGDMMRSILTGTPYPATLLNGVQLRIRAEHEVTRGRAAIIKGYYLRARTMPCNKEVFTMELNEQSVYPPYVLGRLFSVLEALQEAANPGINTTIKDKYFNSASATPGVIFPMLINLGQKHLRKLDGGKRVYYDKQITGLIGLLTEDYPTRMTLPEQGAFQIGYYHQTQKRYIKKEEKQNV